MLNSTPMAKIFDIIYPVGSIYMSTTLTTKAQVEAIFGGTWEKLEGRFLLGSSSSYANGATGGEASHTLTVSEMPSHYHNYYAASYGDTEGLSKNYGYGNDNFKKNGIFCTNYTAYGKGYGGKQMIDNTGDGNAHNNMPPYLVVNMFKRTALGVKHFLASIFALFSKKFIGGKAIC